MGNGHWWGSYWYIGVLVIGTFGRFGRAKRSHNSLEDLPTFKFSFGYRGRQDDLREWVFQQSLAERNPPCHTATLPAANEIQSKCFRNHSTAAVEERSNSFR